MNKKLLIVASNYYTNITNRLIKNSIVKFRNKKNIKIIKTPGTFEIPVVISRNLKKYDAFLALGCVIKGETPHFDYLCRSTFDALMYLSIKSKKPIGNGVITCLNKKQAIKRSYLKGGEAAEAVIQVFKNDWFN